MESSLHHDLKRHYCGDTGQVEVSLSGYRIDVVRNGVLIEIQHASLGSIRHKILQLLKQHTVHVVKPILARKRLVKLSRRHGKICDTRMSPQRKTILDLFGELVYFTQVFPHPRLVLEAVLVEVEEIRYPRRGAPRRGSRRDFRVQDLKLLRLQQSVCLRTNQDLLQLLPEDLVEPFDTQQLASAL
ncbi:MAG: hypothetical protein O2931_08125, partial [Planctomycetota bacterium]|nr:hypothetical protein [Planctomycetota bacterium]